MRPVKEPVPFARTMEGQRIVQLHLAGIPFSNSQVDMTPLQTEFFVEALNHMSGGTNGEGSEQGRHQDVNPLKDMVEARRRG